MVSALTAALTERLRSFNGLPVGQQLGLLGMIAGGLAVIVAIMIWALRPTYAPLFSSIGGAEASQVMQALTQMGVPFRIDNASGQIEIPQQRIAETRLLLAGQGLPKQADIGFELLQEDASFGTSRLIEGARHQRALEGELGRSIAALEPVEQARVHIAQPERSVFIRDRVPPTASVVVHLRGQRGLTEPQVAAIVHLVSSSVPGLEPDAVTVVDQFGRMMSTKKDEMSAAATLDQMEYARRLEAIYVERVQSLLLPIVGRDRIRVQVNADLDFSRVERTEEIFDPDRIALRSEQLNEEERIGGDSGPMGVPGALTNQPPAGGAVGAAGAAEQVTPSNRSQQSTRNYEVDRKVSHIREMPGGIRRLSAAVVVDFRDEIDDAGTATRVPRPEAELESLKALVRDAIGYDERRGDSVNVITASFAAEDPIDQIPFWSETWFLELAKLATGLILAVLILLTVVRPALKQFMAKPEPPESAEEVKALTDGVEGEEGAEGDEETLALSQQGAALAALTGPQGPDQQKLNLEAIRQLVRDDPKRVAQVMKAWVAEDGS